MGRFSIASAAASRKRAVGPSTTGAMPGKVPRAADICIPPHEHSLAPLPGKLLMPLEIPKIIQHRMGNPTQIVGFDIETHDWLEEKNGNSRVGDFEWHTQLTENQLQHARIVQLGWATGFDTEKADFVKSRLVQPNAFVITQKAIDYHGIRNDTAQQAGHPLQVVLQEFLADVVGIVGRGGQVVAHHLEFDAGIILRELRRSHLHDYAKVWEKIGKNGFCTMNPGIGRSLKFARGEQISHADAKHTLSLSDSLECLIPEKVAQVRNRSKNVGNAELQPQQPCHHDSAKAEDGHGGKSKQGGRKLHDAGVDADLCRVLYLALLQHSPLRPGFVSPPAVVMNLLPASSPFQPQD